MPFLWTEGRFIVSRLKVPTLKEITAERKIYYAFPRTSITKDYPTNSITNPCSMQD